MVASFVVAAAAAASAAVVVTECVRGQGDRQVGVARWRSLVSRVVFRWLLRQLLVFQCFCFLVFSVLFSFSVLLLFLLACCFRYCGG